MQEFVAAYPYPIGIHTNHVTCGYANLASHKTWEDKIKDGSLIASAREFVWIARSNAWGAEKSRF